MPRSDSGAASLAERPQCHGSGADDPDQQFNENYAAEPRAIGHPRELGHNELKSALNRGEIRAHLIGLPELQTVFRIVGKPEHSARIAVEVGGQFV
jgi:hypothetical protein